MNFVIGPIFVSQTCTMIVQIRDYAKVKHCNCFRPKTYNDDRDPLFTQWKLLLDIVQKKVRIWCLWEVHFLFVVFHPLLVFGPKMKF
ncbi:hypothetical protein R6Q59_020960 [Mikania micrantha]